MLRQGWRAADAAPTETAYGQRIITPAEEDQLILVNTPETKEFYIMSTAKPATVPIEFDLPRDVLFAMRSFGRPDIIRQKIKTALALLLFRENAVSLGKAADVAEMSYAQFLDVLHSHGIAAYECTEQECAWDNEAVNAYRRAVVKQ